MQIQEVINTTNQTQAEGVIERYAIGGAVGATFYLEPVATLDVGVFITFRAESGSLIISPQPVLDYLKARGCTMEGEYMVGGGWPVQFLPPNSPLVEEAWREAATRDVSGIPARVFTAEHLAAIALHTGRAKDKARVLQFVEAGVLEAKKFQTILERHGLVQAGEKFQKQFLTP